MFYCLVCHTYGKASVEVSLFSVIRGILLQHNELYSIIDFFLLVSFSFLGPGSWDQYLIVKFWIIAWTLYPSSDFLKLSLFYALSHITWLNSECFSLRKEDIIFSLLWRINVCFTWGVEVSERHSSHAEGVNPSPAIIDCWSSSIVYKLVQGPWMWQIYA